MVSAEEVEHVTLATTQVTRGYEQAEVDDFLTRVVAALRAHESGRPAEAGLTATQVVEVLFTVTQFRAGYVEDDVDAVLDDVVATLRTYEGGPGGPAHVHSGNAHLEPREAADDESLGGLLLRGLRHGR